MSERVEHRGTIRRIKYAGNRGHRGDCLCGWMCILPSEAEVLAAYQEHVYAIMGREAAELLAQTIEDIDWWNEDPYDREGPYGLEGYKQGKKLLDRLRAALEVDA